MPDITKALVLIMTMVVFCRAQNDVGKIATAVNKFGDSLYQELAKHSGNIVFSPFALHSILTLLSLGAAKGTREQLLSHLFLPNTKIIKKGYLTILQEYRTKIEVNPKISNALFVSKYQPILPRFEAIAKNLFYTDLHKVDFEKPKEVSAIINEWILNEIGQSIPAVMNAKSFNSQTIMLILNTIFYQGQWNLKFEESETLNNFSFYTPNGTVNCSMMNMKSIKHNVSFTPNYIYLELSFRDTSIKIALISPTTVHGLADIERNLDAETLFMQRNNLYPILLKLKLPKFKLETQYAFKRNLISIGLTDIFRIPDLSHMFENPILSQVNEINQNTVVEINEQGAMAASFSKIQLVARSTEISQQIVIDRPFLFFIYDSKYNIILIRGRVENPTYEAS